LLDEPTNHLDLQSQDILQAILGEYKGTILLVSHDRYLIDALATQIWEVSPEDRALRVFKGTYSEFRASRQQEALKLSGNKVNPMTTEKKPVHKGLSKDQTRKHKEKLDALEDEIAQKEHDLETISQQLQIIAKDSTRVYTLGQEYASMQRLLDERLNEWEKLSKEMEESNSD
jgi:ATP-binding cassette subfamily F protein 3